MALFPTFQTPVIIEAKQDPEAIYNESLYFDIKKGDIVLDNAGKVKIADGRDAWLQWCVKMIFTEMDTCLAYLAQGVEMEYAMSRSGREAKEIAIENTIKEALMRDPSHRTIEMGEFSFEHGVDSCNVTFMIVGADGYVGRLGVTIGGE